MNRSGALTFCLVCFSSLFAGGQAQQQGLAGPSAARPVTDDQRATPVRQGACQALLPAGWELLPGKDGQSADVTGPNGAHAAWGILAVNPAMQRFYGNLYGPPEAHVATMLQFLTGAKPRIMSTVNVQGFYTAHRFSAAGQSGIILYHAFPAPMGQYIITEYVAWASADDQRGLSQAEAVMTSLNCASRVRPPADGGYVYHASASAAGSHRSGSAESDSLKDYNSQLGSQWAHDSAGRNYCLDRASQWDDNGPDGPGYYKGSGVNREKLTPGME